MELKDSQVLLGIFGDSELGKLEKRNCLSFFSGARSMFRENCCLAMCGKFLPSS